MPATMVSHIAAGSQATPGTLGNTWTKPSVSNRPTKLFIGGISRHTTTKQLQDHFSEYGRVLDCVAMKEPNGRSRGFGYVTFHTPHAAERCLRDPQKIDGRLVDMKLAVPEGSANAKGKDAAVVEDTPMPMGNALHQQMPYASWPQSPAGYMPHMGDLDVINWAMAAGTAVGLDHSAAHGLDAQAKRLDCVELLSNRMQQPLAQNFCEGPVDSSCLRIVRAGNSPGAPMKLALPMSASAPEFVPKLPGSTSFLTENKSVAVAKNTAFRTPFGEITNKLENFHYEAGKQPILDLKTQSSKPIARPPGLECLSASLRSPTQGHSAPGLPLPLPAGNVTNLRSVSKLGIMNNFMDEECFVDMKEQEAKVKSTSKQSSGSVSDSATTGSLQAQSEAETDDTPKKVAVDAGTDDSLFSLGSALHASGECRRCNFFTKGRCQNGKDCVFCHLPHQKKKLSRQDKRERQQVHPLHNGGSFNDSEFDEELSEPQAYPFYGVPPLGMGMSTPSSTLVPPGLPSPPGLSGPLGLSAASLPWEPDAEVSPAFVSAFQHDPNYSPFAFPLASPAGFGLNCASFLSTAPPSHNIFSTAPPCQTRPMATATPTIATGSLEMDVTAGAVGK